jgi:hypothetical protein
MKKAGTAWHQKALVSKLQIVIDVIQSLIPSTTLDKI